MNESSLVLIKKGKFKEALKVLSKCEEILEVDLLSKWSIIIYKVCCKFWKIA